MFSNKLWIYNTVADEEADKLSRECNISRLTAKVFINRGINQKQSVRKFLEPCLDDLYDPYLMMDMDKAVDRIAMAVKRNEKIVLYGDFDADGITSVSILYDFLRKMGADVKYYVPDRLTEGYGLSINAIDRILDLEPSLGLMITVDCGITAFEEVQFINEKNIDVLITDHHECKETLPEAYAVLNPHRIDCGYPFKWLAGVGVVYKLIKALCKKFNKEGMETIYLDLAAIGTVADIVPLIDENRVIVKYGLLKIEESTNLGLNALIEVSGLKGRLTSYSIGFILAPRINAAGRMGDAARAVRLFTTENRDEALSIATELDEENRCRQNMEMDIMNQAVSVIDSEIDMEKEKVLVVSGDSWHHGVIGIVASRITEKYCRPCILLSRENGVYRGSGRSIEGFNLFNALNYCEDILDKYGGHELAAGLTLKSENLQVFRQAINRYADTALKETDLVPKIKIDAFVSQEDISLANAKELERLAPFGAGNSIPVFACEGFMVDGIRTVSDNRHLKLKLKADGIKFDAIGFNMADWADVLKDRDIINAVFSIGINEWNGAQYVQLNLKDIKHDHEMIEENAYLYKLDKNIESGDIKDYNNCKSYFNIREIIPERSDLVAVYQYLNASCDENLLIGDLFLLARKIEGVYKIPMNYIKLKKSIEIFEELKLIKKQEVGKYGMNISILKGIKEKARLEDSSIYRRLNEIKINLFKSN